MPLLWCRRQSRTRPATQMRCRWRAPDRSHLADIRVQARASGLAIEGNQGGRGTVDDVLIDRISPDHIGLALKPDGDTQEIEQPAVATCRASNSHGADCAIMVRDLGDLCGRETGRGVR